MNAYDQVLYPSYTHPQTHPDRLAVLGALFGLIPAPPDRCRVLEIGCGNGSNLVPMAWNFPQSQFVGIDLAERPIAAGQRMAAELGLKNVELRQQDILELTPGWQEFDYIIAHGLFSWVPPQVREALLRLCRSCLSAPQGIAFVSYNAYPGAHLHTMLREMMLFHVQRFTNPEERIEQATALVSLLAEAQNTTDEYRQWLRAELERIRGHQPGHLFHDELADISQPYYFTQFATQAAAHKLQYLAEADFFEMTESALAPAVRPIFRALGTNRLLREQYLDFAKCRRFRQTLLCRSEVTLASQPSPASIAGFQIASSLSHASASVDLRPGVSVPFESTRGAKAETDFPLGKAALQVLSEHGLRGLRFPELLNEAVGRLETSGVPPSDGGPADSTLREFLLTLYGSGLLEFRAGGITAPRRVSAQPVASPIVRFQLQHGDIVTSLFHVSVQVEDEIGRRLLSALDGTRDRSTLLRMLGPLFEEDQTTASLPDAKPGRPESIEDQLEHNLQKLLRLGLLVA